MTLKTLIDSQASSVFLDTDHFAIAVTRLPQGGTGNKKPVTAIFIEDEPNRDTSSGLQVVRTGELHVADSVTVHNQDQWTINNELWQTLAVQGSEGGLRILQLQRNDQEFRGLGTEIR